MKRTKSRKLEMQNEELLRAPVQAQQAADKYSALFDFAPVGYFILDPPGVIREVNLAGAALLGLDRRRVIGQRFEQYVIAEVRAEFNGFHRRVRTSAGRHTCELRLLKHGQGSCDVFLESIVAGGEAVLDGFWLTVTDISARKRAEAELRDLNTELERRVAARTDELKEAIESLRGARVAALNLAEDAVQARHHAERVTQALSEREQRLQQALRVNHSFTFEWQPDSDRVMRSASCAAILNLTGDEAVNDTGQGYFQRIHPEDRARVEKTLRELTPATNHYITEYRYARGDGSLVVLEEIGQAAFDATGKLERLVGVTTDRTQRRQAELERFALNERLKALMEAAPVGISFSEDATCQRITGNATALAQFEVRSEDNLSASALEPNSPGRQIRFFRNGRPIAATELPLRRAVTENQVIPPMELEVVLPSGRHWFAELSGAPVHDAHGKVIGGIAVTVDITARRRAEDALRAASEQQRLALQASGLGAWDYHLDTGEVFWDERCRSQWGIPDGDHIDYTRAIEAIHPDERVATDAAVKQAIAGTHGGAYHREFRVVWPDGSLHWISSHGQVFFESESEGRRAVRFIGANDDITERKRLEEAQEFLSRCGYEGSSQSFFQALARFLAESLGMDFVCIDRLIGDGLNAQTVAMYLDGKFEDNVAYALKDTPCGEVVGKTVCCFSRNVRALFPKDAVLQEMRSDSYVGTTLWSIDGKPIGLIAVIGRKALPNPNLAECLLKLVAVRAAGELQRMEAEQALRQEHAELETRVQERTAELQQSNDQLRREIEGRRRTEQELTEAELRYRTVAEFTYDWEYWEAPDYVLRYCSPSCERITGYSPQEFMADPRLLQKIVHPDDASIWHKHRNESLAAPEPRVIQFRIQRQDGSVRWLEHAWRPVLGPDGLFLGVRASNRDITDRKEEELQTQRLREELAHVSRVTTAGQLAASLAHELNQPLAAIQCNVLTTKQLLAVDPPDIAEVQEALDDIVHDSERAGGVIHRLRALFHKSGHERSLLQINDIIEETLGLLRSEFVLKGVTPRLYLEPTLPRVLGNRIELQQVVLNLLVNAIEAMSECESHQRQLRIATASIGPRAIRASISDSGTGILAQPTSRLFEPFFTTKTNGMGMGLAISQAILEAHGGVLEAVNNPDRGATFHLTLSIEPGAKP